MPAFSLVSGLLLGAAFGFALQKGGFCMNTAFRSVVFEKDRSLLRAWLMVLAINLLAVNLLHELRVINITIAPFYWVAAIAGGLVFGLGMALAGGCASGTWYRASKGMLGSFVALIGFAFAATATTNGLLRPVLDLLREPVVDSYGEDLSLVNIFPFDPFVTWWIIVGVLVVGISIFLLRGPKQSFTIGWPWPITGAAVGVLAALAWVLSGVSGRDYGLSFTNPTVSLVRLLVDGDGAGVNWSTYFLVGIPVGAFVAAALARDLSLRLPSPGRLLQQFGGGMLMGIGAAVAGGCNVGHGVTGLSALSVTSFVSTLTTMAGVWIATALIFRSQRVRRPAG